MENSSDLLKIANDLMRRFGGNAYVSDLKQCNHAYFVNIYENMLGEKLPGLICDVQQIEDEIHNIQVVIDSLATDILGIDLSHIEAQHVAHTDEIHVRNLLEIFDGLLDIVLDELDKDDQRLQGDGKENNIYHEELDAIDGDDDPDMLTNNHEILSDVFIEEFGHNNILNTPKSKQTTKYNSSKVLSKAFQQEKTIPCSDGKVISFTWANHEKDNTEDLINEADLFEEREKRKIFESIPVEKSRDVKENCEKTTNSLNHTRTDPWSSLLTHSSSVVEKLSELNEVGKRPRRPLGKEKARKERKIGENVQMHKHTHHHYYVNKDSPESTDASSSATLSEMKTTKSSQHLDKLMQTDSTVNNMSIKTSSDNSPNTKSVKLQTPSPQLVETGVQTEKLKGTLKERNRRTTKKQKLIDKNDTNDSTDLPSYLSDIPSHKKYLQNIEKKSIVTRSKQLVDINSRLKKLRHNVPTTTTADLPSSSSASNIISNDNKRSRSRVSFALDSLAADRHVSFSDTEIDYQSPLRHGQINKYAGRVRKGILRKSVSSIYSDDDSMDDISSPVLPSQSSKFEIDFLRRDEGLYNIRNAVKKEKSKRDADIARLRNGYRKHKQTYKQMKSADVNKQNNVVLKSSHKDNRNLKKHRLTTRSPTKNRMLSPERAKAKKMAALYGQRGRAQNKAVYNRRRSVSSSPVPRRRNKSRLVMNDEDILPLMEEEFPFIYLSPHTAKLIWQKQMREADRIRKANTAYQKPISKVRMRIDEAQKKQELLTNIMKKELEHNQRLKEYKEKRYNDTLIKRKLKERRQNAARARRYYDEYHVRNKARMIKKQAKEERIFKQLFEDALLIQKQRLREMREYAKEKKEKYARHQENEITSMENYYRDQFEMLAQNVAEERHDLEVRQKAQNKTLSKMRSEMRRKMESDIKAIQDELANDDDPMSFRQIDADNLRREFQLATFRANKLK